MDVYLELSSFVNGRIEEREKALNIRLGPTPDLEEQSTNAQFRANLMGDIRSSVADVAIHLPHDSNMFVTIE